MTRLLAASARGAVGRSRSFLRIASRFGANRAALAGVLVLIVMIAVALTANFVSPYDPKAVSRDTLSPPTASHVFGTDQLGRDLFSRVLYGTRVTLIVGFGAALLGVVIGTLVGAIAGYAGGRVDGFLMRLVEIFQIMPNFFLAILVVALFGPGIDRIILVIGILSWPISARLARAEFLSLKHQNFVEAARGIGLSDPTIMFREMLPNASSPLIVQGSLQVATAILIEAGLGFLGLSDPSTLTWGSMLQDSKQYLLYAWWVALFPGTAIFLGVMAFNLVGDGLNDYLNPRLRAVRSS